MRQRGLRLTIASVLFSGAVLIGLAWPRTPPPLPAHAQEARIPVSNLDCPIWCPVRVNSALSSLSGVGSTTLDFHRREVIVQFDPDRVNVAQLQGALEDWSFPTRGQAQLLPLTTRDEFPAEETNVLQIKEGEKNNRRGSPQEANSGEGNWRIERREEKGVEAHQR